MSGRLAGKRCLITGAGQGIGREAALAFAREGADVVATDIQVDLVAKLAESLPGIETAGLDVTNSEQVNRLLTSIGTLDVLFNCAGYVHQGSILQCSESEWRRSFAINVDSMFLLCRQVIPGMVERRSGSIVNMSSVVSSVKGAPQRFAYGATKAAVIGLTKAIAADFVRFGVRCNAICPGTVKTPSLSERVQSLGNDEDAAWSSFINRQPMGRLGEPKEIAALAVYLASDESGFTTGQIHVIDGGWAI